MAITCGPHMLHTAPAMPARTSQTAGPATGAILASSQHSPWHHQSMYLVTEGLQLALSSDGDSIPLAVFSDGDYRFSEGFSWPNLCRNDFPL